VLFDKQEFGTQAEIGSDEEQDFLGIPGLLEPDQVTTLLRQRQAAQLAKGGGAKAGAKGKGSGVTEVNGHRQLTALRKELHSLVGAWSRRTGQPHAVVHANLRTVCGGPEVPQASAEQLQSRIDALRRWFVGKK
jgi:hypothetical protein